MLQENKEIDIEETMALSRIAKMISRLNHIDWNMLAQMFGVDPLFDENPNLRIRLRKAQDFGDPDYQGYVNSWLRITYNYNPSIAKEIIKEILLDYDLNSEELLRYSGPLAKLGIIDGEGDLHDTLDDFTLTPIKPFLDIELCPDEFYKELIKEINILYYNKRFGVCKILIRKLLENIIIDILRKKYGRQNVALFYDTGRNRFHDFSYLLDILKQKLLDFKLISAGFDKEFLQRVNRYRIKGNSNAHTIEIFNDGSELYKDKKELEFIVKTFFRVFNQIPP